MSETLRRWSCEHLAEDAALLVSELVTNAVIHGHSDVALQLWRTGSGVRIEITDRDPGLVAPRRSDPEALGGRGLLLVDTLARNWGVRPANPGKAVWFELGVQVSPGVPGVPTFGNEGTAGERAVPAPNRSETTEGQPMGSTMDEAQGRMKEAAGDLADDDDLKREGKVDQASATAKDKAEDLKDKVGNAVDSIRDKAKEAFDRDR